MKIAAVIMGTTLAAGVAALIYEVARIREEQRRLKGEILKGHVQKVVYKIEPPSSWQYPQQDQWWTSSGNWNVRSQ